LSAAAERLGHEIASEADSAPELERLLRERGYEPFRDEDGVVRLRNCPFHAVAERHPEVACEMNLALRRGLDAPDVAATLEPQAGALVRDNQR
jgi:predicted ArsR family transcriptional regulator